MTEKLRRLKVLKQSLEQISILYTNQGSKVYFTSEGVRVNEDERLRLFKDANIFENVSKEYKYDENGQITPAQSNL